MGRTSPRIRPERLGGCLGPLLLGATALGGCQGNVSTSACVGGVTLGGRCWPKDCPDQACREQAVCRDGECVTIDCVEVICTPGTRCLGGDCMPCEDDQTCGLDCAPCSAGSHCAAGNCTPCSEDQACGLECADCTSQTSDRVCLAGIECGCTDRVDCAAGQVCDESQRCQDCAPVWVDATECDCVPSACQGCAGVLTQVDGCGNTRTGVACNRAATGCSTFCCGATCMATNDPLNCGACGRACHEGWDCLVDQCALSDTRGAAEVYLVHPWITDQIDERIRGHNPCDPQDPTKPCEDPPVHKLVVMMWQMGPTADDGLVTWTVGDRTGFYPSVLSGEPFARGPNDTAGGTAVQMFGDQIGIFINTASQAYNGQVLPIVASHDWPWWSEDLRPWASPGSALSYSFWLQVPTAIRTGQLELYITPVFALRDAVHNISFWMTAQVFDPRGPGSGEAVICDCCSTCTKSMIVMSTIAPGKAWSHPTLDSSRFSSATWTGYRYFEYRVSTGEFAAAINALADTVAASDVVISRSPGDYQLVHVNLNPETSTMIGPGQGQLGLSVKDIRVARYPAVYDKLRLGMANAGPDAQLQVFFKTDGDVDFSEAKSSWASFPSNSGGWSELRIDLAANLNYQGTITALRIDPFNANQGFGVDYVYVCARDLAGNEDDCIRAWTFDSGPAAEGWTLSGVGNLWVNNPGDEGRWGGQGNNGDPFFTVNTRYQVGR